jgi:hypothetical protein
MATSRGGSANAVTGAAAGKKVTVYEKLNMLNDEIIESIKVSCGVHGGSVVDAEINALREASFKERSPEAEFSIKLFRKYVEVVSKEKDDSLRTTVSNKMITNASDEQDTNTGSDFYKFSSVALEGTSVQITIQDAPRTNIFWYRAIVMMFSLIATIVLGSSRYISFTKFSSNDAFSVTDFRRKFFTSTEISMCQFALQINTAICDSRHLSGYFDMRPYQAVMGIAILVFIHSVVFTAYYILPVDENENKYVPGMQSISIRDTVY